MIRKIILMLFVAVISINCNAQAKKKKVISKKSTKKTVVTKSTKTTSTMTEKSDLIYLKEDENIFLKDQQMNVTFIQVTEDSRCPEGVNCIWAGNATVEVEFMGTHTRPIKLKLSTTNNEQKELYNFVIFNGYKITLVDFSPTKTDKDLKGSYKIGLKFEKNSEVNPTVQSGGITTK